MQLFHLRLIVCLWSQVKSTIKVCAIVYCAVFTNLWCDAFRYICIYINRRPRIVYQQPLRFIQNRLAIQNLASMQLAYKCAFPVNEIWTTQLNANSYVCMWYHCQLKRSASHAHWSWANDKEIAFGSNNERTNNILMMLGLVNDWGWFIVISNNREIYTRLPT